MTDAQIIIPFRSDDGHRQMIFDWNAERLARLFKDVEITVADSDPDKPFNPSQARNNGYKSSKAKSKHVFFCDADTVWDDYVLHQGIKTLEEKRGWVFPYSAYHVLSQESGRRLLQSPPTLILEVQQLVDDMVLYDPVRNPDHGRPLSGFFGLKADDFEKTGGFNEDFVGWGFEDWDFAESANHHLGMYNRVAGNVFHIWHPVKAVMEASEYKINQNLYEQRKASQDYSGNWLK